MRDVDLIGDCTAPSCRALAAQEYDLLNQPQYTRGVSIRPSGIASGRTFIRRYSRATHLGYYARREENRSLYRDQILEVNASLPVRQGRPMDPSYADPSTGDLPMGECREHEIAWYGVFNVNHFLAGYATVYHCGELAHISQFLVHGDHLRNDAAYLLMRHLVIQSPLPGVLFYNRHDSGHGDGLRFFKERCGFREEDVRWKL